MIGRLGELASSDITDRPIVVIPIGSCEQHGPHLPLDTDTRIACAVAERFAASPAGAGTVVAPPLAITASGEHAGFAGTLSIGLEALELVVIEVCRSAGWASGIVLVNGHGGNAVAIRRAEVTLRAESRGVLSWWPRVDGDAHAGRTETSLMLAIAPASVRMDRARAGRTEPIGQLMGALRIEGVRGVSPSGVLGDPHGATASEGGRLLDAMVADLSDSVMSWRTAPDTTGAGPG